MINQNFVIVGAIIAAIGSLSYLIDTVKGKVKPNLVSLPMVLQHSQQSSNLSLIPKRKVPGLISQALSQQQ